MNTRSSFMLAIGLVCAGLFIFGRRAASETVIDLSPVSGTDNTAGAMRTLTAGELAKLSSSDNQRIQSDGNWPMTGAYAESSYIEFVFSPDIPSAAVLSSVSVTHEYYRTSAMVAAKLEIWDGSGFQDVPLSLPHTSGTAGEISETKDISSLVPSSGSIKIRFLAYRNDIIQSGIKTSHDLIRLAMNYTTSSSSPVPTQTLVPTPSETAILTPSNTPESSASPSTEPSETPATIFTATPEPTLSPVPTASLEPAPSLTPSLVPIPTPSVPEMTSIPLPRSLAAAIVPSVAHKKTSVSIAPSPVVVAAVIHSSRLGRFRKTIVDIWHLAIARLRVIMVK